MQMTQVPATPAGTGLPWVQVAPGTPYFVTENGEPWHPIGQNDAISWPELEGLFRRKDIASVDRHLAWLADEGVTSAAIACTHGLFVGKAVERLRNHPMIHEVVTTDTVPPPYHWPELTVRSVAGLFADAMARVHAGESVSSLFDGVDPSLGPPQSKLF